MRQSGSDFQITILKPLSIEAVQYFQHFDLSSDPDPYTHHGLSNRTTALQANPVWFDELRINQREYTDKKEIKFSSNIRIQFK
jgi:hypothetical protein